MSSQLEKHEFPCLMKMKSNGRFQVHIFSTSSTSKRQFGGTLRAEACGLDIITRQLGKDERMDILLWLDGTEVYPDDL